MKRIEKRVAKQVLRIGKLKYCASEPKMPDEHAEFLIKAIKTTEKYFHQPAGPKVMHSVCTQDGAYLADIGTGPRGDLIAEVIIVAWNLIHDHYTREQEAAKKRKGAAPSNGNGNGHEGEEDEGDDEDVNKGFELTPDEPEPPSTPRKSRRLRTITRHAPFTDTGIHH